ncbi:hypothetical protein DRP05_04125 [Archaeoglobales archaeon]|nr:MAG: hypothetical protein DRO97_09850 [Archaeoglobales archaeon]RLI79352.1 MAG: hypothetical protein DRP05_04125 [Archaeoglobales archaeon]
MAKIKLELTQLQKDILHALITLHKKKGGLIKGKEIAGFINRNPGVVRDQMRVLKVSGIVRAIRGPKGGYTPTTKAYRLLYTTKPNESVRVPVIVNEQIMEDLTIEDINLPSITHLGVCQARMRIAGDIKKISTGDRVVIGPTPVSELIIYGEVTGREDTRNVLIIDIKNILALPKDIVGECMSSPIITVNVNKKVSDAAKILAEKGIYCALVRDRSKFVGIFTLDHVAKAIAENKLDKSVKEVMRPKIVAVEKDTPTREALMLMNRENARFLVVTDSSEPVGVITDQEILTKLVE